MERGKRKKKIPNSKEKFQEKEKVFNTHYSLLNTTVQSLHWYNVSAYLSASDKEYTML